jgi:hypothetical protein
MIFARVSLPFFFLVVLAACSGNIGGGQSTLPGAPPNGTNVQQIAQAVATPTPNSASNVATLGDTIAPQPLPQVMGFGGSITFPHPTASPSAAPNAKSTAAPADGSALTSTSVGITASTVEPSDAPPFGGNSAKRHAKHDPNAVTPLLFITLLATADVTLGAYPKIAVDIPREIASKHRDDTFALALFDPETKEKTYRLAVAERDLTSPPPGTYPSPSPTPAATPAPTATPFGINNGPMSFTPPPVGTGIGSSGLPPENVAFTATAATLILKANRPVVFALYAVPPQPSPSPSPVTSASSTPAASASAPGSAPPTSAPATAKPVSTF